MSSNRSFLSDRKGRKMTMTCIETRPYCPGDETAICGLFEQAFGRILSIDEWKWRFANNPAGGGIVVLAWDGDVLAAHYAVTSVWVNLAGHERIHVGLSGTTMTHPDYRGEGLFPRLARDTYSRMVEAGMKMVFGFPNNNSHRGLVRDLGWSDIYEVPILRQDPERLPSPGAEGGKAVPIACFGGDLDRLWERARGNYPFAVSRDSRYLNWRISKPGERYIARGLYEAGELRGYAIHKRYGNELQIIDMLSLNAETTRSLLLDAADAARAQGASSVGLWMPVNNPIHHVAEQLGFINGTPVTYFGALALAPFTGSSGVLDYRNWFLTMGDSDVF